MSKAMSVLAALAVVFAVAPSPVRAAPVRVVHAEGLAHGYLALSALDGSPLAEGDLIQHAEGDRVTARLRFRFKDGSLREETTVYMQRGHFRFMSNHVVQKGPAFRMQLESNIDRSGHVKVRYSEGGGEEKTIDERLELPPDVANGMTLCLLKNLAPGVHKATVSMVAITPKPRLVNLELAPAGEETFTVVGTTRKALHYVMKVHVPGVTGILASVLDKIPPDSHFWIVGGEAPTFVKAEAALAMDGPIWRIELASPTWPSQAKGAKEPERPASRSARAPPHPPR